MQMGRSVCLHVCYSFCILTRFVMPCTVRNVANAATMTERFSLSSPKWTKPLDDLCSFGREGEVEWILLAATKGAEIETP